MSEPNEVLSVVRQWVWKADSDLQAATYILQLGEDGPTDAVCFHAQQCIEKYVKAFLVLAGIEFPWTHNLGVLIAYLPQQIRLSLTPEEQERLTNYATTTRYPGDYEPIAVAEARQAVRLARRARREIRRQLPQKAWQKPSPRKTRRRSQV